MCFSIYIKVKSDNGNLQADVEIKRNMTCFITDNQTNDEIVIEKINNYTDEDYIDHTFIDPNQYRNDMNNSIYHNTQQSNPALIVQLTDPTGNFIAKVSPKVRD